MCRPHLVPLPFPLLGLCWWYLHCCSVRHVIKSMKNKKNRFDVKRFFFLPRLNSTPFFTSDCEMLQTSSRTLLLRPHLTCFFLHDCSVARLIAKFGRPQTKHIRRNKGRKTPPDARSRNGHGKHVCRTSRSTSSKRRGHFVFECGECVFCVDICNYLVSVKDRALPIFTTRTAAQIRAQSGRRIVSASSLILG